MCSSDLRPTVFDIFEFICQRKGWRPQIFIHFSFKEEPLLFLCKREFISLNFFTTVWSKKKNKNKISDSIILNYLSLKKNWVSLYKGEIHSF